MDWKEVSLESITSKIGDGLHGTPKYDDNGDYYFINGNNLIDGQIVITANTKISSYSEYIKYKKELSNRTIFISINGTLGNIAFYNNEKVFLGKSVCYINIVENVDKFFIKYVLESNLFQHYIEVYATGATIKNMGLKAMRSFRFELPPLKTQQKIASLLSNYDKLIENNTQRIKLLESMAEELYKEWFVRLRFPGYEDVEVVDGVPEGWEKIRLDSICNITSSKRIFLSDYTTDGIPFYRGKEITLKSKNEFVKSDYYIAKDKFIDIQERFGSPKLSDILITAVGTLGSIYLVRKNDGDFYFKDGNIIWLKDFKVKSSLYVYYFFKSREFQHFVEGFSIGSSQKALTIDSLKKSFILYPNKNLIYKFSEVMQGFINQIETLEQKKQTLKQTRDLLLPRLMSGKLNVEDLDII